MSTKGKAMSAVRRAIEQLNQQLPVDEKRVDPHPQTRLTGEDGCLDSLGLIDLITNTEKAASEEFVAAITLVGKDAFGDLSRFSTVQALADYVAQRVREVLGDGREGEGEGEGDAWHSHRFGFCGSG